MACESKMCGDVMYDASASWWDVERELYDPVQVCDFFEHLNYDIEAYVGEKVFVVGVDFCKLAKDSRRNKDGSWPNLLRWCTIGRNLNGCYASCQVLGLIHLLDLLEVWGKYRSIRWHIFSCLRSIRLQSRHTILALFNMLSRFRCFLR